LSTRTLSAVTRSAPTSAVPMAAPRLPAVCEASRHQEHAAAGWPAHREAARQPSNANGGRGQWQRVGQHPDPRLEAVKPLDDLHVQGKQGRHSRCRRRG
jgi:hypothetical protein